MENKITLWRALKYGIGILLSICVSLAAVFVYSLESDDIVMCALDDIFIVKAKNICKSYVEHVGVSDEFINTVNNQYGISYLLNSNSENKFIVTEHLIKQGVMINSINRVDGLGLPPLHAVFITDDIESFRFLLAHGVDLNAVAEKTGEDIFTFGERIIASHPTENNIMMIRLLKSQ